MPLEICKGKRVGKGNASNTGLDPTEKLQNMPLYDILLISSCTLHRNWTWLWSFMQISSCNQHCIQTWSKHCNWSGVSNAYILNYSIVTEIVKYSSITRRQSTKLLPQPPFPLNQGLWSSSLQFTSPLEFNAIFRAGFPLRLELNGWSKIRDPVTAKFKHVTVIVTCTLLCCDDVTYVPALWNFQKADLVPYPYGKKYTTFSFPVHGALASNICLRDAPTCSCIQLYT